MLVWVFIIIAFCIAFSLQIANYTTSLDGNSIQICKMQWFWNRIQFWQMKFMTPCLRLYFSCYFDLFKLHDMISMSSVVLIHDNCIDVLTMMMEIRIMTMMMMMMMKYKLSCRQPDYRALWRWLPFELNHKIVHSILY